MLKKFIVHILEALGALAVIRWYYRTRPVILMYHRISEDSRIPGIAPAIFEEQLQYLIKHFHVMNMREYLQQTTILPNTVVITFDDGHEDFYSIAWPLLKKYKLSASLFIVTEFVEGSCWLWPDLIKYILINAQDGEIQLPQTGLINLNKKNLLVNWQKLANVGLSLNSQARAEFINLLADATQLQDRLTLPQSPFASVTWEQLSAMVSEGLDVGSHTVSHPILSQLSLDELNYELQESKTRIEQKLPISVQGICYPNGMAKDISEQVLTAAQKIYQYGLVAFPAHTKLKKPMHLGRIGAPGDMENFKIKINQLSRNDNVTGEYR